MLKLIIQPEDEKTWEMVQAAFEAADETMTRRNYTAGDIDCEYLRRAIERLWSSNEDREALKAKVQAAVSIEVDALFDQIGDDRRAGQ